MFRIDTQIQDINSNICKNIKNINISDRGFASQNILAQIRNLVDHIYLKIYAGTSDIEDTYQNICKAKDCVLKQAKYKLINKFTKFLQISTSHYTLSENNPERLMLKYCEYLIKIKNFMQNNYHIEILQNIHNFPIDMDTKLKEYYEKIAEKVDLLANIYKNSYTDRYYIQKIKPFFINNKIYYEVTFSTANDNCSKFDRVIAFTAHDILPNYSVKLSIRESSINIMDKAMPILIIDDWKVSIRPCEINHFADLLGKHPRISAASQEYKNLMSYLTVNKCTLNDIINLDLLTYNIVKKRIIKDSKTKNLFDVIDSCKTIIDNNYNGTNILKYLLNNLHNRVIKNQYNDNSCSLLSNLNLKYGCISFDEMPYATSLIGHNPPINELLDCISTDNRTHELLARIIKNNTEENCQLYTHKEELIEFENIDKLVEIYNNRLYEKHQDRKIEKYKDFYYIKGYEKDTVKIINRLKSLSLSGVANFSNSVEAWLKTTSHCIDCPEKKEALKHLFENSKVSLIYGSAGTGKSTMINHISVFFNERKKLYLAKTNPAIDNLKYKVTASNSEFRTINSFLSSQRCDTEFDIVFVDECSTVSNRDILAILEKASFKLIVLVGDIFQIESIVFGNWFSIIRNFIPKTALYELVNPYRTSNKNLLNLWEKVRNIKDDILETITKNDYSVIIDDSLFEKSCDDEIILCLNYDGLYGINNINRFLQESNPNVEYSLGVKKYKVGDPILFSESSRFGSVLYNNLKGKLVDIKEFDTYIQFCIEIDKVLNEFDLWGTDIKLLENSTPEKSTIAINISKYIQENEDDESNEDNIVPFEVAYSISIHKAQGLEYKSVKIVITNEIEEMISHNIFYTAITRAREKLKIYWTPETEKVILTSLKYKNNQKDIGLLSSKYQF